MSDTDTAALTPQENAYFESKGAEPASVETKDKEGAAPVESGEAPKPAPEPEELDAIKLKEIADNHLKATREERDRRRAAEKRSHELEIENARFQERFKLVESQFAKPSADPPDPDADPFGYTKHVGGEVSQLKQQLAQHEQQREQSQYFNRVVSAYKADFERFAASDEGRDVKDAREFLIAGRIAELKAMGHADPEQALMADEYNIVHSALQSQRSPAETIMAVAKARGFQSKAAKNGNGDASAKLDAIEKGQSANKSLSSAGGESPGGEMTAEALIKMPMDEFEAWMKKNPAKARRLYGGR